MTSVSAFIWQFVLAWLVVCSAVYLPGRLLLRLIDAALTPLEGMVAALVGGGALLALVYWILLLTHRPGLLWSYVLVSAGAEAWFILRARWRAAAFPEHPQAERLGAFKPLWALMFLGIVAQTRFTFWTAWPSSRGLGLLAWHCCDATWHVFTIFQLSRGYPPQLGGFAPYPVVNYHMMSHVLWAAVLRLAPVLDVWHLYFRVAPIYYSGLLTLTTFIAARAWSGKTRTAYLAVGFALFSANFTYLLPLLRGAGKYPGVWDPIFWVQSPFGMIFNPGVSSAFVFLLGGLWAFTLWMKTRRWCFLILTALLWGVLPGFKVYAGFLMIIALFLVALVLLIHRRDYGALQAWSAILPIFLVVFLPPNTHATSVVRFLPGYNLGVMLVDPNRMGLMSSLNLKLLYVRHPALVALLMAGLAAVFVVGNLGVRTMALPSLARALRFPHRADPALLFIALVVAGAFAAPLLFVQVHAQFNTVQFAYFGLVLAALPAAEQFWLWAENWSRARQYALLGTVLLLGLPSMAQFYSSVTGEQRISPQLLEALLWLKGTGNPSDVVLRPLPEVWRGEGFQKFLRLQERGAMTSRGAWDKEARGLASGAVVARSSATVAAAPVAMRFDECMMVACTTFKNSYLEEAETASVLGYPIEDRVRAVRDFYESSTAARARDFLNGASISHVMLFAGMQFPFHPEDVPLSLEFGNEAVKIYRFAPSELDASRSSR